MSTGWWTVIGAGVFFLGLLLAVMLHEIGHMVPARLFGCRVSKFSVGFGPTLFSRRRGETEYALSAIPLGGYVRIDGMTPQEKPAKGADPVPADRAFYNLAPWKKLVILAAGPLMNLVVLAPLAAVGFAATYTPAGEVPTNTVASITPGSPAQTAGLEPGDTITAVNGTAITDGAGLKTAIQQSAGQTVTFTVTGPDGTSTTAVAVPANQPAVGVTLTSEPFQASNPATLWWDTTYATVAFVPSLVERTIDLAVDTATGQGRDLDTPMSVVGVTRTAGEASGVEDITTGNKIAILFLLFMGLNIALGVLNLLPFLPLDGGHMVGAAYESVRNRWAAFRGQPKPGPVGGGRFARAATYAGLAAFLAMFTITVWADIVNPIRLFS
jgi:membrane-associated protease RseP (regulator of RpoE activity)